MNLPDNSDHDPIIKPRILGIISVSIEPGVYDILGVGFTQGSVTFNPTWSYTKGPRASNSTFVEITLASDPPDGTTVSVDGSDPVPWDPS